MSSVTFPTNLGGNGQTYTDDDNPTTGLRDGGWRTRFVPCLEQTVAIADTLTNRIIFGFDVSSSSVAVSVGTKTLTTSGSFTWAAGMFVTIARTSATANYLFGQVVSYNASTDQLVVNVTSVAGSGTYTDWTIAIAPPGLAPSTFTGPATITVGSGSDALRITQTGGGNALVVEDSNPDSTPFVVDSNGYVVVGNTSTIPCYGFSNQLELLSTTNSYQLNASFRNDAFSNILTLAHSRNGAIGSHTIVQSGDDLGALAFAGSDGTAFIRGAQISAQVDGTPGTNDMPGRLIFSTTADNASNPTERMRIDNQGRVGIGGTPSAGDNIRLEAPATGAVTTNSIFAFQEVRSNVTTGANTFRSSAYTQAAAFTLSALRHFFANPSAFGAGSTVTNQFGFLAENTLTGATNNYGFYSNIASGSGRWNFYAAGTADNYFAGSVAIGSTGLSGFNLRIGKSLTGAANWSSAAANGTIQSDVVTTAICWSAYPATQAAAFTISSVRHFDSDQGTIGAGSIVSALHGFRANSSLTGATNNFGFYSNIAAPTSGGSTASNVASVSSTGTTVTVNTAAAHGLSSNQTVTISLTANATALVSGVTCTILSVGTTDFTLIGASSNTVGVSFTATGAGTGSGTVTLNQQNSGKTITVVNTTQFTYTASSSATFTLITASGTVTPTTRYNFYAAGTAENYFAGDMLIGSTTALTSSSGLAAKTAISTNPSGESGVYLQGFGAVTNGIQLVFTKTRGATAGNYTSAIQSGDDIGFIPFEGSDGVSALRRCASITVRAEGTFSATSAPGAILFGTTLSGFTSPTTRMTIDNRGNIYSTSGTTAMTDGFFYIPSAAGAPSGVPTAVSGRIPMYYDTTNNHFYVYNGAWKKVLLA